MSNFQFMRTDIEDVIIVEPKVFGDSRGYFLETYKEQDFFAGGINCRFVQDNQSRSRKGVLRGLHFQKEHPQAKLVRVIQGEVFDVAVDLRKNSKNNINEPVSGDFSSNVTAGDLFCKISFSIISPPQRRRYTQ
ncbi:MAG: dTDP-4-dehydrorhamnose 3,5-epimerase family protein [Clostridia bacterium]|nr:dTDP-4-dehydrorhamnose 3,5-epimerase family protein [Clostridia bacterium]